MTEYGCGRVGREPSSCSSLVNSIGRALAACAFPASPGKTTTGRTADVNEAIPRRRLAMARLLIHEAGGDTSSSEEFAAAAGRLLERFSGRLSPVIGAAGVEALLLR